MHKSSTHLSTQLSVQPHFCPIFRPLKQHEMGTLGQHFFDLQLHPFNGSFNTRLKAPVRSMSCHHCHPHTAPFSPVLPSMATCTPPLPCAHTINALLHPSGDRCKPVVARSAHFHAHCISQIKKSRQAAVFSGHTQRLDAVAALQRQGHAPQLISHLFVMSIKAN